MTDDPFTNPGYVAPAREPPGAAVALEDVIEILRAESGGA